MSYSAWCSSCRKFRLTVRRSSEDSSRLCAECFVREEFTPGIGRKLRAFISWRIRRDDRHDDLRALATGHVDENGWPLPLPW